MASASSDGHVNILQVMDWRFSQIMQMISFHSRSLNNMLSYNLEQLNIAVGKINEDIVNLKRASERDRVEINRAVEDITDLNENWELINERIDKLEELVDLNEVDLKCCNLRFMGVPEGGTHSFPAIDVIVDILNQYTHERSWNHRDINRAFRAGDWRDSKDNPRPIVVQMHRWSDKMAILQDQDLREALREDNIRVAAELTTRQRGMVDFHTKQGKRAYYWKGKLQVEEKQQRFDRNSFPVYDSDRRHLHYQRREVHHFQEAWPAADTYNNDRYSTRDGRQGTPSGVNVDRRRNDEPRVVPGHRTYSQVVKEGRPAHSSSRRDYRTSRNPSYWEKRPTQNFPDKNRRRMQSSLNHFPPEAEHSRIVVKVGEQKLSYSKHSKQPMSSDETTFGKEVKRHQDVRTQLTDTVHSGTDTGRQTVVAGLLIRQDSVERQTTEQPQDDQLADCNYESDADPSSGVDDEEPEINPGEPQRDLPPADTSRDQEDTPPHHEEDEDVSPEGGTSRLADQVEVNTEASDGPAAAEGPEDGAVIPAKQSDPAVAGVIQSDAGAGEQSLLDTVGGQAGTREEEAVSGEVSEKRSGPKAKANVKEQRTTRVTTRAGSSKQRSCSQGSIRDAFKRANIGGGSLGSDRDRDGQSSSPKCLRDKK